jgi:hypothetical protein
VLGLQQCSINICKRKGNEDKGRKRKRRQGKSREGKGRSNLEYLMCRLSESS